MPPRFTQQQPDEIDAAQADRDEIVRDRLTKRAQERVLGAIERKLQRVGIATRGDLERACHKTLRDEFDHVFETLIDTGLLVEAEGGEGRVERYELGPGMR